MFNRQNEFMLVQGAEEHLLIKYLDDILGVVTCFKMGKRRKIGERKHTEEDEEKDAREGRSK